MNIEKLVYAINKAISDSSISHPDREQLKHLKNSLVDLSVSNAERIENGYKELVKSSIKEW